MKIVNKRKTASKSKPHYKEDESGYYSSDGLEFLDGSEKPITSKRILKKLKYKARDPYIFCTDQSCVWECHPPKECVHIKEYINPDVSEYKLKPQYKSIITSAIDDLIYSEIDEFESSVDSDKSSDSDFDNDSCSSSDVDYTYDNDSSDSDDGPENDKNDDTDIVNGSDVASVSNIVDDSDVTNVSDVSDSDTVNDSDASSGFDVISDSDNNKATGSDDEKINKKSRIKLFMRYFT